MDNMIFENTLLDNLNKDNIVNLNVEGKAYHEWAMKIMEFLQKNNFLFVISLIDLIALQKSYYLYQSQRLILQKILKSYFHIFYMLC